MSFALLPFGSRNAEYTLFPSHTQRISHGVGPIFVTRPTKPPARPSRCVSSACWVVAAWGKTSTSEWVQYASHDDRSRLAGFQPGGRRLHDDTGDRFDADREPG